MKSDELMIEYKAQKVAEQNAALDEARLVKHMMAEYLELGLPVWLGEFCDELESASDQDEFEFHPGGNYDADAQVKLLRVWRGIGVQIRATAIKKKIGLYGHTRGLSASMNFAFDEERLWGKTLYRKEVSIELPSEGKENGTWVYADAKAQVDAKALGMALVEALQVNEERRAIRTQVAAEKEVNDKLAHERRIEGADDFGELRECFEKAKTAYPGDEARWKAAYEKRVGELDERRIEKERFEAEAQQATAWLENWRSVLEANRKKLSQVQAQWSHPLQCFVLEYGVVAEDEDGGDGDATKYVETRQMYVDASAVDEYGNWFEVGRYKRCVRVSHPVRVWARTFEYDDAAPNELISKLWVRDCLEYIKVWVNDDMVCVTMDLAEAGFVEFPALNLSISKGAWRKALQDGNYSDEYAVREALGELIDGAGLSEAE